MAKATATCTCATCGTTFVRTKICYNRREADEWEAWAAENITECPACYAASRRAEEARQRAEEASKPLTLRLTAETYLKQPPVVLFWDGDTAAHKDEIKALGYRWMEAESQITYGYSVRHGERKWIKVVPQEDAYEEIRRAQAIGAEIDGKVLNMDYLAKLDAEKQARINAAESAGITKPDKPDCYPDGKWNGKIYGNANYGYRIYVDNCEVHISAGDADALRQYADALQAWQDAIKGGETA